jgi:hypothetical protein
LLTLVFQGGAQPFRYISGTQDQRDSIKMLGIRGYKEFSATFQDSTKRILTSIIEYDKMGNVIRNFRHDMNGGWENQYTWKYDDKNQLIEEASYSPDSLTFNQRFFHCYDDRGNQLEYIVEWFDQGKLKTVSRTVSTYDTLNHITSLKVYSNNGLQTHYEYTYNKNGARLEELVFSPEGKLLWRRPSSTEYEDREPYGFPTERDPELEALMKVTVSYDQKTGNTTHSDGYGKRVFNSKGLLIYWYEGNFKHHWFDYSFY